MAFDATLGGSEATSYVSVARSDEIMDDTFKAEAWDALTDAQKQTALMAATSALNALKWNGDKCSPSSDDDDLEQALQWPRDETSCQGIAATCSLMPLPIETATCQLALQLHDNPNSIIGGSPESGTTGPVKRQKLGDLEQEFFEPGSGTEKVGSSGPIVLQKFPWLLDVIGCFYDGASSNTRLLLRVRS